MALSAVVVSVAMLGLAAPAAADFTWSNSASGAWSTGSSWSGNAAPSAGTPAGTLSFPASACTAFACPSTTDDIPGLTASALLVANGGTPGYPAPTGWVLGGSTAAPLTLDSGLTETFSGEGMGGSTVALPIILGGPNVFSPQATSVSFTRNLSGNQTLTVTGTGGGNVSLEGQSNEVGAVTINPGDAFVGEGITIGSGYPVPLVGDLNGTNGNQILVENGGTFVGSGRAGALTVTGGTLSVGNPRGISGTLTVPSASIDNRSRSDFPFTAAGATAGTDYPQLLSSGRIALGGSLNLTGGYGGGCPTVGTTDTLISTTGTLTGRFVNAPDGATLQGSCPGGAIGYRINYNETGSPQTMTATVIAADTWSGLDNGGHPNWSEATNWQSLVPPAGPSIDQLVFPMLFASGSSGSPCPITAPCYQSTDNISGLTVGQLTIADDLGYSLGGTTPLTLGGGGINAISSGGNGRTTIGVPIKLGAGQTWTLSGENGLGTAGQITDRGGISGAAAALTVSMNSDALLQLASATDVGALTLAGTRGHTGASASQDGIVKLPSGGSLNAAHHNAVALSAAELDGDGGSIGGPLTVTGGYLKVGSGSGTPTGSLSLPSAKFDAKSGLQFELEGSGTAAGTDYGQLKANGNLGLGGASLTLDSGVGGNCVQPPLGGTYTLISTTGALTGTFAGVPDGSTVTDECTVSRYRINYHESGSPQTVTAIVTVSGPPAPANRTRPAVSGNTVQGQTLTLTQGIWSNNPTQVSDQWQDCDGAGANCTNIAGATGSSYTLAAADVGHTIVVSETASNAAGTGGPVSSNAVGPVVAASVPPAAPANTAAPVAAAPSNTAAPVATGTATVGQSVGTTTGGWSGTPPLNFVYQWQRCDPGCANIAGATAGDYTLSSADAGANVQALVTAVNSAGFALASTNRLGPVQPNAGQINRALAKLGGPSGKAGKIGAILNNGGYTYGWTAPGPGKLTAGWYQVPPGAHLTAKKNHQPVQVATVTIAIARAGAKRLTVRLTLAGRRLLKHAGRRLRLTSKASYTPTGGEPTTKLRSFTVRR